MTLDGFLTFLTLAAAIYAVATAVVKLRAKLTFVYQAPLAIFAFGLILYLQFFEAIGQPCLQIISKVCPYLVFQTDAALTPQKVAFLVVIFWMGIAFSIHKFFRAGPFSLPTISKLVDELNSDQSFKELLGFLEPNLLFIGKAAKRKLLFQRFYDWLSSLLGIGTTEYFLRQFDAESKQSGFRKYPWMGQIVGRLRLLVPSQKKAENAAEQILRTIYNSDALRDFLVKKKPYSALPLLHLDAYGKHSFAQKFIGSLISQPESILYQELKRNQGFSSSTGYHFPENNRLLHFLFADTKNAKSLAIWKPIGDKILNQIDPTKNEEYVEFLNKPPRVFDEECWEIPTFAGIQFFRLMVTAAAVQEIRDHMWLAYLYLAVRQLEQIYDTSNPHVDENSEFPTRNARLIYEIIDALGAFTRFAVDLPENSLHREIPESFKNTHANIPLWSVGDIGKSLKIILKSKKIGIKFSTYIYGMVLDDLNYLPKDGNGGRLRAHFIELIIREGDPHSEGCIEYGKLLVDYLGQIDQVLIYDLKDYCAALETHFPGLLPERLRP